MRQILLPSIAALVLASCGSGEESRVYDESEADQAAAAIAGGADDVTIRSDQGEVRVRSGDADTPLPGGLPAYPGAERTAGYSANSTGADGGSGQLVAFTTDDSPEEVIAFYREAVERSGREISASMEMEQLQSISVADADERGGFTVTATNTGSGTSIMIAGGRGGA